MPLDSADASSESRIRDSFNRQPLMTLFGAELSCVEPGLVEIRLPFRQELCQQHGFIHAGALTTIVDNACGYAALSQMPPDTGVLTVEFKVNFLSPARGDYFLARGKVTKSGRTLSVCHGEVVAITGDQQKAVASMQATMMCIEDRGLSG